MNLIFYLISTVLFLTLFFLGLFIGREVGYILLLNKFGYPSGGDALTFGFFLAAFSILSGVFGLAINLMIIERLGRRWGSQLSFGSHPVLKLTLLSFLTFLALLVLLLFLLPTSSN